jgi:hypothetical protein
MKYVLWAMLLVSPAFANSNLSALQPTAFGFRTVTLKDNVLLHQSGKSFFFGLGNVPVLYLGFRSPGDQLMPVLGVVKIGDTVITGTGFYGGHRQWEYFGFVLPKFRGMKRGDFQVLLGNGRYEKGDFRFSVVPEPGTLALFGTGLSLVAVRWRRICSY